MATLLHLVVLGVIAVFSSSEAQLDPTNIKVYNELVKENLVEYVLTKLNDTALEYNATKIACEAQLDATIIPCKNCLAFNSKKRVLGVSNLLEGVMTILLSPVNLLASLVQQVVNTVGYVLGLVGAAVQQLLTAVLTTVRDILYTLLDAASEIVERLLRGLQEVAETLIAVVRQVAMQLKQIVGTLVNGLVAIATNLVAAVTGLVNSVLLVVNSLVNAVSQLLGGLVTGLLGSLGSLGSVLGRKKREVEQLKSFSFAENDQVLNRMARLLNLQGTNCQGCSQYASKSPGDVLAQVCGYGIQDKLNAIEATLDDLQSLFSYVSNDNTTVITGMSLVGGGLSSPGCDGSVMVTYMMEDGGNTFTVPFDPLKPANNARLMSYQILQSNK